MKATRSGLEPELCAQIVTWRRHLHAHPELSGQEVQTAAFVAAQLRKLGYEPQERVGGTYGVTATLRVGDTPAIALRADMDALPIQEENEVEYRSTNPGVMHACGHDTHTAMLLGAAAVLRARAGELKQSVKLIFQPSEELWPGGAKPMIDAGVLEDVERVFGLHIWAGLPAGTLATRIGPLMACVEELEIEVTGHGGHAAMPQQCVDSVVAAAQLIVALQTVVSRALAMTDAAVISVTQLQAGTVSNVLPGTVKLRGTIRTFDAAVRARVHSRIRDLVEHVPGAFGASGVVRFKEWHPALVNDAACVAHARAVAERMAWPAEQVVESELQGGGEDFAYYALARPAAFLFLGARDEAAAQSYPHHHPRFNVDETVLPLGAALLARCALQA